MNEDNIDFVLAAWLEEGRWHVEALQPRVGLTVTGLVEALGAYAPEGGVLGLVSVAEDFFVLVRIQGQQLRFFLSDVSAANDWSLAAEVLDRLGADEPVEFEADDEVPAGDLTILSDWGMPADEITFLAEDLDLYPDDVLGSIASRLGFGDQFEQVLDDIPV